MIQRAAIYERLGRRLLTAEEGTTAGTRETLPIMEITGLPNDAQGQAVLFILNCYREGPKERPIRDPKQVDPLYLLAGVRTWSKFSEIAKRVLIRNYDGQLSLVPMRDRGPRYGYEPIMDAAVIVMPTPQGIGSNLDTAFARCE